MYHYVISYTEYNEEYEDGFSTVYETITHDKKYEKKDFEFICNNIKSEFKSKGVEFFDWSLAQHLCNNYGFKRIKPIAIYGIEEEN